MFEVREEPSAGSTAGPGEQSSRGHVTGRMKQTAKKYGLNKWEPGEIQILPDFLSLLSPEARATILSALGGWGRDENPARITWQSICKGNHCLLDQSQNAWFSQVPGGMREGGVSKRFPGPAKPNQCISEQNTIRNQFSPNPPSVPIRAGFPRHQDWFRCWPLAP